MPDLRLSTSVNKHYLNKLMKLAQVRTITAAEDVVDIHGIKVLGRGHRIDAEHFHELSGRKLKKPIESMLAIVMRSTSRKLPVARHGSSSPACRSRAS